MTGVASKMYRVILRTRASPARSSFHGPSLRHLALFLQRKWLPRERQIIFSKSDDNNISHPSCSSYSVTLTFLPLRGRVCVFCLPIWVGLWLQWKWHCVTSRLGHKRRYSFCLVCWNIAFGVLSCHGRSPRLPCCQEAQATWRSHMKAFWPRALAEVPSNSQHQPPHVSEDDSTWLWPPAIESFLLRPQILGNRNRSSPWCPVKIPDPQNLWAW